MSALRFQIHLLTFLILTQVLAVLVYANTVVRTTLGAGGGRGFFWWGFPIITYEEYYPGIADRVLSGLINLPVCLALLGLVYFAVEFLSRSQPRPQQ
jgi:hypothetical protein